MKILFLATRFSSRGGVPEVPPFQQADLSLLRELGHEVRVLLWSGKALLPLLRSVRWADLVYSWHISYAAFLASLFARKLVCVVGGFEFANLPDLPYGNLTTRRMRFVTKWVWKRADALLYVDPSLMEEAAAAFGHPGKARYLPTGYDPAYWSPSSVPRRDAVLTVGHAPTVTSWRRKGIDLFVEAAGRNPDLEFHIVGDVHNVVQGMVLPSNVVVQGYVEDDRLRDLYRQAKVYCQLSIHEGLPNSLCEAMLCGCVPVGTSANGIPHAIGDTGFIVQRESQSIDEGIRRALDSAFLGDRARERVMSLFSTEKRKAGLRETLDGL